VAVALQVVTYLSQVVMLIPDWPALSQWLVASVPAWSTSLVVLAAARPHLQARSVSSAVPLLEQRSAVMFALPLVSRMLAMVAP
jgi:hypothetical protein